MYSLSSTLGHAVDGGTGVGVGWRGCPPSLLPRYLKLPGFTATPRIHPEEEKDGETDEGGGTRQESLTPVSPWQGSCSKLDRRTTQRPT